MKEIDNDIMNFMVDFANTTKEAQASNIMSSDSGSAKANNNKDFQILSDIENAFTSDKKLTRQELLA